MTNGASTPCSSQVLAKLANVCVHSRDAFFPEHGRDDERPRRPAERAGSRPSRPTQASGRLIVAESVPSAPVIPRCETPEAKHDLKK